MSHRILLPILAGALSVLPLRATDPPHKIAVANTYGSLNYCSGCHKFHGATGGTLTTVTGNANLCQSCHVSGGLASAKPMPSSDQAIPAGLVGAAAGGTSHRWDSGPQGRLTKGTPNSSTGTITPSGAYTGAYASTIQIKITTAGATGAAKFDWSMTPPGSTTFGTATTGVATSTAPAALGTTGVSLAFSSTGTFVLNDIFYLYVRADLRAPANGAMAGRLENGKIMCSSCHDQHLQVNQPFDPAISTTYNAGITNNRHFQRVRNDDNSMCGDCHAARNVGKGGTSHPVNVNLAAAANTKSPTLGTVLSAAGNVTCLTCHDIHKAPTTTTPAGMLLRVSNTLSLCTDCHTLADTATTNTHTNPTTGILWPGDGYGGSTYYPAPGITDATLRGACKNCHTPHGWPNAANPTQEYAGGLGARQDNLCTTCHDSNGPSNKDVRTQITKVRNHPVDRTSGRMVGCGDCHNPHMATPGVHTYATTATVDRNRIRAAAGGVLNNMFALRGVDGVQFNYAGLANWAAPTAANFTLIPSGSPAVANSGAQFEYQVCFKCHTSYSFGGTPPAGITPLHGGGVATGTVNAGTATFTNGSATVTGATTGWKTGTALVGAWIRRNSDPSGTDYRITAVASATSMTITPVYAGTTGAAQAFTITRTTDLAQEFNPANRSGHPVVVGLNSYTGNVAPKPLRVADMKAPWNVNVGTQTMMCSDCHNTDAASPAAQGPHGSAAQFMLKGANAANWPNVNASSFATSWCANCHNNFTTSDPHGGNHTSYKCYQCHVVIPHGSKMSRLIGSKNMPPRYAYNNDIATMTFTQFKKQPAGTQYQKSNCQASCAGDHSGAVSGGETW